MHNYIHKNGLKYINLREISYNKFIKENLSKLLFIFKFYFKISFLLDGTCVASSDYIDYLENGETPPENSQYWVAQTFDNYIKNQFTKDDRKWLNNHNVYNMQFSFLQNNSK